MYRGNIVVRLCVEVQQLLHNCCEVMYRYVVVRLCVKVVVRSCVDVQLLLGHIQLCSCCDVCRGLCVVVVDVRFCVQVMQLCGHVQMLCSCEVMYRCVVAHLEMCGKFHVERLCEVVCKSCVFAVSWCIEAVQLLWDGVQRFLMRLLQRLFSCEVVSRGCLVVVRLCHCCKVVSRGCVLTLSEQGLTSTGLLQ